MKDVLIVAGIIFIAVLILLTAHLERSFTEARYEALIGQMELRIMDKDEKIWELQAKLGDIEAKEGMKRGKGKGR